MTKEHQKKLKTLVIRRYQMILDNSKKTAKMFKSDSVTIASFSEITDNIKAPTEDIENKSFMEALNKVVTSIFESAKAFAEMNDSKRIPLEYIEILVEQAKRECEKQLTVQ